MANEDHVGRAGDSAPPGDGGPVIRTSQPPMRIGFYGSAPITKPTITGSTGISIAKSIAAALAALGLATDSTT